MRGAGIDFQDIFFSLFRVKMEGFAPFCRRQIVFHQFRLEIDETKNNPVNHVNPVK